LNIITAQSDCRSAQIVYVCCQKFEAKKKVKKIVKAILWFIRAVPKTVTSRWRKFGRVWVVKGGRRKRPAEYKNLCVWT